MLSHFRTAKASEGRGIHCREWSSHAALPHSIRLQALNRLTRQELSLFVVTPLEGKSVERNGSSSASEGSLSRRATPISAVATRSTGSLPRPGISCLFHDFLTLSSRFVISFFVTISKNRPEVEPCVSAIRWSNRDRPVTETQATDQENEW